MREIDVVAAFQRTAEARPERHAFTWLHDGDEPGSPVAFGELLARVRTLAAHLGEVARPGDRVILAHRPGVEFAAALLGAMAAGLVAVPTYPPKRERAGRASPSGERWRTVAGACSPSLVLADDALELAGARSIATPGIPTDARAPAPGPVDPAIPAFLQFTSGSTRTPRGVVVGHDNLAANIAMMRACFHSDPDDVSVTWLPPYHDMGLVGAVLAPLVAGTSIVAMAPAAFLQRPARWLRAISRFSATVSGGPDFAYERLVRTVTDAERAELDLSTWRVAYNGAEPIRAETVRSFLARFAPAGLRSSAMTPCYGLAEATLMVASQDATAAPRLIDGRVSCGPPRPGVRVRVVEPGSRRALPPGDEGEIEVSGSSVARGYWGPDPAGAFRDEPDGRWLATGDLGRLVDGELVVTGRIKETLVVDGRNVAPQDVEAIVTAVDPRLVPHGAAAIAVDGRDARRIVVVAEVTHERVDWARVTADARRRVAEELGLTIEALVPLRRGALPRTTSGKIRRVEVRDRYLAGTLPVLTVDVDWAALVRDAVAKQLGVGAADIPTDQPLSELGLDSRGAVELAGALERLAGRAIAPTACWDHPTIAALAVHLGGDARETLAPVAAERGPLAVVGLACRLPGADDLQALRELLRAGASAQTSQPPASRPDRVALGPGAYLADPSGFDADWFGISAREADRMDPQQRLLLEVATEALHHAAIAPEALAGRPVGVFVGVSQVDWARRLAPDPFAGPAGAMSITANRISYALDLRGPSVAVDTACSSSLVALHQAATAIEAGDCELALVGGVNLILEPGPTEALAAAGMLSPSGQCRPFDAGADGYVRGEGCCVVVVAPLQAALREGYPVFAVLRGTAVGQDGRSNGLTAPSGLAQRRIVEAALARAGVAPELVGYVECHGTGTSLGDPIEWSALAATFAAGAPRVGSIKANVGHLEAAAGLAGFVKACLAVHDGELHPHPHTRISPRLDGSLALAQAGDRWPDGPRVAGVSSYGFGGTGAHAIVEQPPSSVPAPERGAVAVLSADRPDDLAALAQSWRAWVDANPSVPAASIAASMLAGRPLRRHRVAWAVADRASLLAGFDAPTHRSPPAGVDPAPRVAFLVAGHGGSPLGAARGWYGAASAFTALVDRAEAHLVALTGRGVLDVLLGHADPAEGQRPSRAQPALVVLALAQAAELARCGARPAAVLGHSLGELTAACLAGAVTLEACLTWVARRGHLVESLALPGELAALTGARTAVSLPDGVELAATNAPDRFVVAGPPDAVARAVAEHSARGLPARVLGVGQGYHSACMDPVLEPFAQVVGASRTAAIPWWSTVTGQRATQVGAPHWVEQLRRPVQFQQAFDALVRDARPTVFIELGPSASLASLARASGHAATALGPTVYDGMTACIAAGVPMSIDAVVAGTPRAGGAPGPVFRRVRHWLPVRRARAVATAHPLLGVRVISPRGEGALFQSTASLEVDPELVDHRAFQAVVVAGASQVSLALSAHVALGGSPRVTVRSPTFTQGLLVEHGEARTTQLEIDPPDEAGARAFRFSSLPDGAVDTGDRRVHSVGSIAAAPAPGSRVDRAAARARCRDHLDQDAFLDRVAKHHIQAGPTYRWCAEAWTGDGEALGRMVRPPEVARAHGYVLHPGLIDASFQLAAVTQTAGADDAFLLFRIGAYHLFRVPQPDEPLWTHAQRLPRDADDATQRFHIRLVDDAGELVAEAVDLELRRASLQSVLRALRPDAFDGLFHEVHWERWRPTGEGPRAGWWVVGASVPGIDARPVSLPELSDRLAAGERPAGVLVVPPPPPTADVDAAALWAEQEAGALTLLRVARAIGDHAVPLVAMTRGAMPEHLGSGELPAHATLRGVARVLAAERPGAVVRVIDIAPDADPADGVAAALDGTGEAEIAVRSDGAYVPRLVRADRPFVTDTLRLDPTAAYVVTGGTGGLGLQFARWLVGRGARHLVLLARRPPRGAAPQAIERLRELGVEVRVEAVDVADEVALGQAWRRIGRPVRGLVHAAGALADGWIEDQDEERLWRAFAPKAAAVWNLHRLLGDAPLDLFVLCSSIASLFGSPGQAAYAAANAFLDAFAAWRPGATAIWWGPWAEVGMAARQGDAERAARERLGVLELAPDVAVEAVEQALRADRQQAVARFDLERFQGDAPLLRRLAGLRSRETPALVASLRADPDTLDDRVAAHVRALLTELTGRPLTLDASIQALGLDSMSALDAAARLREDLGVELHVTRFLRDTPVHELARELAAAVRSGQTPAPADPPPLPPVELPAGTAPPAAPARAPAPSDFDIGLFFFSRVADDDAGYRLLQDAVQIADRAGLGSVWLPERHFHAFGGLYPNPSVLAASLAPLTERIRLRAGSVVLPLHHPARVAEEWAVVDRLSGGRVDLAFVRGWGPDDFALRPEDFDGRTEVLERRLDEVRRLWRGEAVPFVNGAGETRALRTWPRPVQPELPVWLTCTQGDERFLAAGRLGVNVLTALLLQSPDELERRIALYRSALADHGHDPSAGRVALMVHAFVGRDDAFTRDQVREPLTRYIDSSVDLWKQASAALQGADRLARDQILAYAFERYYETSGLFGPVSACVRKAAALRALGVDELACLIDFGVDDALVLEGIRHLPAIRAGARA